MRNKNTIKEGVVLFSPITSIYYKMVKGVLFKYPTYSGAPLGREESAYTNGFSHMRKATVKEIRELR